MNKTKFVSIILITLFLVFTICEFSYGNSHIPEDIKVYMIVANKLTLTDIEKMPNLYKLINEGNFGLMNVRGLSGYSGAESFATINASTKAYANNESSQFYNLVYDYRKIYENRVGPLESEYAIGNIQIGRLYNQNESNKYSPNLGALGDSLHNKGFKTAIFGNSDTDEEKIRTSALIPMDSKGLIDYGNLDNILVEDMDYPYGIRTDYNKILREVENVKSKASLIVIDTGDLNRLNSYGNFLSLDIFNQKRSFILEDIDSFIRNLVNLIDKENSLLMVLSPNSGEERIDGNRLSPIILWGKDIKRGLAISSTTNRLGIVSNLDISPTIADFLNLSTVNMAGDGIQYVEKSDGFNYIKTINGRINLTSRVRSKTLLIYGSISIIIILILGLVFLLNIRLIGEIINLFEILLLLIYSLPIVFILSSLITIDNLFKFYVSLIVFVLVFIIIFRKFNRKKAMYFINFTYFIIIVLDILLNGAITKYSILSHDPIIGARYFGIGNEMVGIFLAGIVLNVGLWLKVYKNKIIPVLIMLLSIILVGHPKLGANVGGTIALLSASLYFILEMNFQKLDFKSIFIIIVLILIGIVGLGYIDTVLNPKPTHLGKTLILIKTKGIGIVQNIINRKLLMNIKLIGISIWTKVLFTDILVLSIISYTHENIIGSLMENGLGMGILSCIVGSIIGFLVNDSGLILAAISINMLTIFLLFVIINDEEIYME